MQQTISNAIIRDNIKNNLSTSVNPTIYDCTGNGYTLGSI